MRNAWLLGAAVALFAAIGAATASWTTLRDGGFPYPGSNGDPARAEATAEPAGEATEADVDGDPAAPGPVCGDAGEQPGDSIRWLETADGERVYRLRLPPAFDGFTRLPVVLNFHGYGQPAEVQEAYSGLVPVADRDGFVLITPEGSGYPSGWSIPGIYNETGIDDVAFVQTLVETAVGVFCGDPDRVYATGMSNGGEMTMLAACSLDGLFAAVAPVAGFISPCPGVPLPVIAFHGTWDENVPFESAVDSAQIWAATNGCEEMITTAVTNSVELWSWIGCAGATVEFYVLFGAGHTWPGATQDEGGAGVINMDISAAELMASFFASHPREAR